MISAAQVTEVESVLGYSKGWHLPNLGPDDAR